MGGEANYIDAKGNFVSDNFGPEIKTEESPDVAQPGQKMRARFDFLPANTNFTVAVCGVTRRKQCGTEATRSCKMRSTPPRTDQLSRAFQWLNDRRIDRDIFRLRTSKLSQRNGPICCMRIVVVRMRRGQGALDLPQDQSKLAISSHKKVHDPENPDSWGAYIAEILGPNFMGRDILVGDGQNTLSAHINEACPACQSGVRAHLLRQAQFRESQLIRNKR